MIPIVTLNNKGEVNGRQAFNDNLTQVEQVQRNLLATLFGAQNELTNSLNDVQRQIMAGELDEAELTKLNTAAFELRKSVSKAIATFNTAVAAD